MTKREFRVEMLYRNHAVKPLKRISKGDVDYIVYETRCHKCHESILFFPNGDPSDPHKLNIRGSMRCPQFEQGKEG